MGIFVSKQCHSIIPGNVDKYLSAEGDAKINKVHGICGNYYFIRKYVGATREEERPSYFERGGTVQCFVGKRESDGILCAIKSMNITDKNLLFDYRKGVEQPINIATTMSVQHIVSMARRFSRGHLPLEIILNGSRNTKIYIVEELMDMTVLEQYDILCARIGERRIIGRYFLEKILDKVCELLDQEVLHGDIKPSNFLVKGEDVRLTDLSLSRQSLQYNCFGSTRFFTSPHRFKYNKVDVTSESFSIGISLATIMNIYFMDFLNRDACDGWFFAWKNRDKPNLAEIDKKRIEFVQSAFDRLEAIDPAMKNVIHQLIFPLNEEEINWHRILERCRNGGDLSLTDTEKEKIRKEITQIKLPEKLQTSIDKLEQCVVQGNMTPWSQRNQ